MKTLKRNYARVQPRPNALTVLQQLPNWIDDYNENHPHRGLRMRSPREFILGEQAIAQATWSATPVAGFPRVPPCSYKTCLIAPITGLNWAFPRLLAERVRLKLDWAYTHAVALMSQRGGALHAPATALVEHRALSERRRCRNRRPSPAKGRRGVRDMSLIIINFEASSLLPGSFPIEVGWVEEDGSGESHLIRPADGWLDPARGNPGWSPESEAVHGITLATLLEHGEPVEQVSRRVEAVLCRADALPCSDAPSFDGYWLERLLQAGGVQRQVKLVDIHNIYDLACRSPAALLPPMDTPERRTAERRIQDIATRHYR